MERFNPEVYLRGKSHIDFSDYRELLDHEAGIIRHGLELESSYEACSEHHSAIFTDLSINKRVIAAVSNSVLGAVENNSMLGNSLFATLPSSFYDLGFIDKNIILRDMTVLPQDVVQKILGGDQTFSNDIGRIIDYQAFVEGRKNAGDSFHEYMFMTKYDMRGTHEKFSVPASDFETPNGFIISTRPEEIKKYIPEIVALQESVFTAQAMQTGYFAGLSNEDTLEILQNPDFIPIIARDKQTNEIAMCTLFAPDFVSFDSVPWINPNEVARHLLNGEISDCLTLPLVVISKTSGLGLMKYAVQMATHETVYRLRPDSVAVMYESNPLSVFITPRTIHGQIERAGGKCTYKHGEVYYFTESSR